MLESNFRLNTDVTVTKDGFICGDMPEVVAAKCLKRRKKTEDEDEGHLRELRHKLQKQHDLLMTALTKAPKYENQIWAVEEQLKKKKIASEQKDLKELKNAQAEETARQQKLDNEQVHLDAKKSISEPLQPRRLSTTALQPRRLSTTTALQPRRLPTTVSRMQEPSQEVVNTPRTRRQNVYVPQNQEEWDRLQAWKMTQNEYNYSIQHGTLALETLVARGAHHLIPPIVPGQSTPLIDPLIPVMIPVQTPPVQTPPVAQSAALEAPLSDSSAESDYDPVRDSPLSDSLGNGVQSMDIHT